MLSFTAVALALQVVAFATVAFKAGGKYALVYFASVPLQWFVVAEPVSGHIVVATHLLWLVPVATTSLVVWKRSVRAKA
jgi:hypothetical protein